MPVSVEEPTIASADAHTNFLKEFDGKGQTLVVGDGDVKRADLKLLQSLETLAKTESGLAALKVVGGRSGQNRAAR